MSKIQLNQLADSVINGITGLQGSQGPPGPPGAVDGTERYDTLAEVNALAAKSTTVQYIVDKDGLNEGEIAVDNNGFYTWDGVSAAVDFNRPFLNINSETVITSKNIFNKDNSTDSKRVTVSDGSLYTNSAYSVTEFIPVTENTDYRSATGLQHAFYDNAQAFIASGTGATFTTPNNAEFVRFDYLTSNEETQMLALEIKYPSEYEAYKEGVQITDLAIQEASILDPIFESDKLKDKFSVDLKQISEFTRVSKNLFNKASDNLEDGYTMSRFTGVLSVSATNNVSEFIPVLPSTDYSVSEGNTTVFFDENKVYISGHATGITTYTTPANCKFIRIVVRDAIIDTFIVVQSSTVPNLYQEYEIYAPQDGAILRTEKYLGKKWNVLGDSITASLYAYWSVLAPQLGMHTVRNYGVGGTAVAVRSAPWDTNAMCIRYADMDDDADLITIMGGTNDFNQVDLGTFEDTVNTTFYGALHIMLSGIVSKYPTAKIAFFGIPPRYNMQTAGINGDKVVDYRDAQKEVCDHYAIPFFDTLTKTQLRPFNSDNKAAYFDTAGLHPTALGHQMLADNMLQFLSDL